MGFDNSPDIFQHNMNDLFHWFEFICAHAYKILILTKGDWEYYSHSLDLTLNKLKEKVDKCNIENSSLGQTKMEYLGLWVTHNGIKHIDKITRNKNMKPHTLQKYLWQFIVVNNSYHNMWPSWLYTLAPITIITPSKANFKWTKTYQYAFVEIKRIAARDTLLTYTNVNEEFKMHTNARNFQLGAFIRHKGNQSLYIVKTHWIPKRV